MEINKNDARIIELSNSQTSATKQAEKQVKLRLALEKISQLENVQVTDDEIEEEFKKMADNYQLELEQVKTFVGSEELKKDIAVSKTVDIIKNAAVIKQD